MPKERFFHPQWFQQETSVIIENQEFHHLAHVMRAQKGDELEIVNGQGQLAIAYVQAIEKKRILLSIKNITTSPLPTKRLILAQAIPRINRLEFILEKSTELGMTEMWLFPGAHSDKKSFNQHQLERLEAILIAAMKQCGRLFLPTYVMMPSLKDWPKIPQLAFFGDTRPTAIPLTKALQQLPHNQDALFFIGPESGFSNQEVELFQKLNVKGVKLHPNTLRTDTAALAALSLLSHWMFYTQE